MRTGTAPWGRNGFIDAPEEAGGMPVLKQGKPQRDKNRNGIPDKLEKRYPDIESYLNSLVPAVK